MFSEARRPCGQMFSEHISKFPVKYTLESESECIYEIIITFSIKIPGRTVLCGSSYFRASYLVPYHSLHLQSDALKTLSLFEKRDNQFDKKAPGQTNRHTYLHVFPEQKQGGFKLYNIYCSVLNCRYIRYSTTTQTCHKPVQTVF